MADGSIVIDTRVDNKGALSGVKSLGGAVKGALGGLAKVGAAASAAIAGVATAAVKGYADYEQLVGGVETLFGTGGDSIEDYAKRVGKSVSDVKDEYANLESAQSTVLANADKAFQTAGLSANDYMETVTSFSASLVASVGGDTQKAADYADRAIIDMSDNANKMGTDMQSIQNAYQGFAKQNYTMLDNLKLGYGGTKTEMERLIKDASQMKDVQKELGVEVDASSMSFGNIVNAISVMQKSMNIAGTTSKEASSTISGSLNSVKAAWDNLLVGMADPEQDFGQLVNNLVTTVTTAATNIIPRLIETVPRVVDGLGQVIQSLIPQIGPLIEQLIPTLITAVGNVVVALVTNLPTILKSLYKAFFDAGTQLFDQIKESMSNVSMSDIASNLVDKLSVVQEKVSDFITTQLPTIITTGFTMLSTLITNYINNIPTILSNIGSMVTTVLPTLVSTIVQNVSSLITQVGESIKQNLPSILENTLNIVESLVDTIAENAPMMIDAGINFIKNLVQGLMDSLPMLIERVPTIVSKIANIINDNAPKILKAGVDIVITIVKGLIKAIPTLIKNIPKIIKAILDVWQAFNWINLGKTVITGIKNGITAMLGGLKSTGGKIVSALKNAIANLPQTLANIGRTAMSGFGNAMAAMKSFLFRVVTKLVTSMIQTFSTLPSKMLGIGKNLIKGLWNGISNMTGWILDKIQGFGESVLGGIKDFFGIHSPSHVMRDEVGRNLALGVAVGIDQNKGKAKKSAEQMGKEILASAKKVLAEQKANHKMSLAEEVGYWDEIRKATKKGTSAREQANKQYLTAKKSLDKQLLSAEKSYLNEEKKINEELKKSIDELNKAYEDSVKQRKESILSAFSLFEAYDSGESTDITTQTANLQTQVDTLKDWESELDSFGQKVGTDSEIYEYMKEQGVGMLQQLKSLNRATEEQFNTWYSLYQQRQDLANTQAVNDNESLRLETEQKIVEATSNAMKSSEKNLKNYKKTCKSLGVSLKDTAKISKESFANIAKYAKQYIDQAVSSAIDGARQIQAALSSVGAPSGAAKTTTKTTTTTTSKSTVSPKSSGWSSMKTTRIGAAAKTIPRLASGAVIPPNREFMAVLGDQKHGTNIEAPLATIQQALANVLQQNGTSQTANVILEIDGTQFGKAVVKYSNKETQRVGLIL